MRFNLPLSQFHHKPIYLLYGYDPFLILECLDQIKANYLTAKRYHFNNFNQFMNFLAEHRAEIFNLDLFSQGVNTIVEISLEDNNFSKLKFTELEEFLNEVIKASNVVVIFIGGRLSKNIENTKLFKYIDLHGLILSSKNLNINSFKNWIINNFKLVNLNISAKALEHFITLHHNNLLAAKQSIEQLGILFGGNADFYMIDLKDLLSINLHEQVDQAKYTLFDLQNVLKSTDQILTIRIVKSLKLQEIEPILVLWGIVQVLKQASNIKFNQNRFREKIAWLWQKAAVIDLTIKQVDLYEHNHHNRIKEIYSLTVGKVNYNNLEHVWNLILELCIEMLCIQ